MAYLLDIWFAPKRFESTALYERLGVLFVKRYVPTGGDFVRHRYGIRIIDVRGNLDSLIQFERCTRRLEAVHVIAFVGFLSWSLWRVITRQTTLIDFGIAILIYILLILSPAMLQRYNRLRVHAGIRRLTARQLRSGHGNED
jgi:Glycosyl-4,4'-diaponeurosporenoate acyltransferase